jgi:hypothetical protein
MFRTDEELFVKSKTNEANNTFEKLEWQINVRENWIH